MKYSFYKEHESYYLKLREDGIMHIHFKADAEINLTKYKQIIEEIGLALNQKKVPFLISKEPFVTLSTEIRDFVATEEGAPYSIADAILSDGLGFTLLINFYIRIKKPIRPTRLFTNESDAINWLLNVAQF